LFVWIIYITPSCYYKIKYTPILKKQKERKMVSTKAARNSHGQDSSYFLGWQEYDKNPYHPTTNPRGIIQMGLAENQVFV